MNCEKNAVVCEGYPEKQIWKSGREKAGRDSGKNNSDTGTESSLSLRAYELYEQRGRGEGLGLEEQDWLQAEQEVMEQYRKRTA